MQISPKLEVCGKKEVDIRNQRPRLRMNSLFLGRKAGGGVVKEYHIYIYNSTVSPIVWWKSLRGLNIEQEFIDFACGII